MAKTYTTVQGDMWDSIAYAQLGSTDHTDKLMNANLQYRKYYIFPVGHRREVRHHLSGDCQGERYQEPEPNLPRSAVQNSGDGRRRGQRGQCFSL